MIAAAKRGIWLIDPASHGVRFGRGYRAQSQDVQAVG